MAVDAINALLSGGRVKVPRMACRSAAEVLASSRALAAARVPSAAEAGWLGKRPGLIRMGWPLGCCQSALEMPGARVSAYPAV
jgi:hypothetical protein